MADKTVADGGAWMVNVCFLQTNTTLTLDQLNAPKTSWNEMTWETLVSDQRRIWT